MKGKNYIRKLGHGRFLEQIVSSDYVKNINSLTTLKAQRSLKNNDFFPVRCHNFRMKGQKGDKRSSVADNSRQ